MPGNVSVVVLGVFLYNDARDKLACPLQACYEGLSKWSWILSAEEIWPVMVGDSWHFLKIDLA